MSAATEQAVPPVQKASPSGSRRRALLRRARAVGDRGTTVGRVLVLAGRRLWGFAAPVVTVISGMGWLVLLSAIGSFIVGFTLGWQEFVYLGVTLVAGLLVAVFFIFGRSAYQVAIELTPRRVVAGDRALGRLVVRNARTARATASRLELPVGVGVAEFAIPALAVREEHEELFAVPTQRRAVIVAGPALSVRGDQLGLLRRTVRWADPVELFVHPVTTRLAPSAAGLVRDLEGEVTKTITNNDISFHALRAYEPGDDRRYVHWRTSARTGQLMVRQFEETRRSQLILMFAADRKHFASEEEFELGVSILASLGVQVLHDGTKVDVVTENAQLRTRSINTLLDDSSRITWAASPFSNTRDFARLSTSRLPAPSVVMVVSGSLFPVGDFRAVQTLFGLDTQTVGFRADLGATPRLSMANGLRVATVGSLDELVRLVRRAS